MKLKRICLSAMLAALSAHSVASGLVSLTEDEMSAIDGQALLAMGYTAPSGTGTGSSTLDYGYYKLGLEGILELNANIRNLQLGCGGRNGPDKCDIDIENLSLSGLPQGRLADGTPNWGPNGRASTSAILTNPFLQFAIKNPTSASTREIVGFRASAEQIEGWLSAGTANIPNPTDGIKTFSGYITVAETPVTTSTQASTFGLTRDQMIYAPIIIPALLNTRRHIFTNVNRMTPGAPGYEAPPTGTQWGINVPSIPVSFNFPQTVVKGNRMSQLDLTVTGVPVGDIAIAASDGGIAVTLNNGVLGLASTATFFMGTDGSTNNATQVPIGGGQTQLRCNPVASCSYIRNINANVQVKQNFNLIHNLPLSATGGYLSLQKEALRWPGSNIDDVAQPGWWMSFAEPLSFGALNPTQQIPMQDVLPQVATFITTFLATNQISLGVTDALNAVFGVPIYKSIGDINVAAQPASLVLENLPLDNNQAVVSNCFGTLTFC